MSTLETRMTGRRVAARNADRRRRLLLVGLLVLLAGLLAFQLPKLLKGSGSSSSTASPPAATTAPGAASAGGVRSVANAPTSAPAQRARAIQRMTPRDPFVPGSRESSPASAPSSAPASAPASAPSSAPTSAPSSPLTFNIAPRTAAPATSALASPADTGPGLVTPAKPTAAAIWTNGKRQIVGVAQTFHVGDATFKLAAVDRASMRLEPAAGSFTGGKRTITVLKGRAVILENNATGVRYTLRFTGGTSEAPTVQSNDATQPSGPEASAGPSAGTSTSAGS